MQTPGVERVPRLPRELDPGLAALAEYRVGLNFTRERVVLNDGLPVILFLDTLGGRAEDVHITEGGRRLNLFLRLLYDFLLDRTMRALLNLPRENIEQTKSAPLRPLALNLAMPAVLHPVLHDELARRVEVDPLIAPLAERAMWLHISGLRVILEELTAFGLRFARRIAPLFLPDSRDVVSGILSVRTPSRHLKGMYERKNQYALDLRTRFGTGRRLRGRDLFYQGVLTCEGRDRACAGVNSSLPSSAHGLLGRHSLSGSLASRGRSGKADDGL